MRFGVRIGPRVFRSVFVVMMFCPKCKSILMPKKVGVKSVLACSCGYSSDARDFGLKESGMKAKEIAVVDREVNAMPVVEEKCPKCGHRHAYHCEVQTRSADEAPTRFYKCLQCACTWRAYK